MHNSSFYSGVLHELHRLDKLAENAAPVQPTPAAPKATPVQPTPAAPNAFTGKPVYQFNHPLNAPQQKLVNDLSTNALYRPYITSAVEFLSKQPNLTHIDVKELGKQLRSLAEKQVTSNAIKKFAPALPGGNPQSALPGVNLQAFSALTSGAMQTWNDIRDLGNMQQVLENSSPADVVQIANLVSAQNPEVAQLLNDRVPDTVEQTVTDMSGSELLSSVLGRDKPDSSQEEELKRMVMSDPRLKGVATKAAVGRAGSLAGGWLKENWGKLALAVGGIGVLTYLLKNIMSNREKEKQQAIVQQAARMYSGPTFL